MNITQKRKNQEKFIQEDLMVKTSVIIRNKNEATHIGMAIQSVLDHIPNAEIIIMDNNSTDDSLAVVKLFNFADIRVVNVDNYSPGRSINLGVDEALGEQILVLSAHAQITKWDQDDVNYSLGKYCSIFGHQTPIYRGKKITPRYIWSHFGQKPATNMYSNSEGRQFLHNAFAIYSRKFLMDWRFDEGLNGKEDRYWAKDVVKLGHTYLYTPNLRCNHYWTPNGATWTLGA